MIRTADVLLGICKQLRTNAEWDNYNIVIDEKTTDEVEETEEDIRNDNPYFSVQVDMLSSSNFFKLREKLINVYIYYVDARNSKELRLNIMDELTELFDTSISVGERHLPIFNKHYLDNNNTFKLTVKYFDDKSKKNTPIEDVWDELMEVIKVKYTIK